MTVIHDEKSKGITEFPEVSGKRVMPTDVKQSALPSGAATASAQATTLTAIQSVLTAIQSVLTELQIKADPTEDQSVYLKAYRSSDATYQALRLDKATDTIQTIDYEHHEIHSGSHFFYNDSVSLNSSETQDYLITTPNTTKWAHLVFAATGSAITQVDLYEATDKIGTTTQATYNSDRNNSTNATVLISKGTSGGTTDGVLVWTMKSGSATVQSRAGMTMERGQEIILKQNTKYIIRITSGTNTNLTNLQLQWYEHQNLA